LGEGERERSAHSLEELLNNIIYTSFCLIELDKKGCASITITHRHVDQLTATEWASVVLAIQPAE